MPEISCRYFNGYKPCGKNNLCDSQCPSLDKPQISLLVIHLGALGAVVRSTALLSAIKRKYPSSRITWVTDAPAHHLISCHPLVDRILTTQEADLLILGALEFEVGFVIDKSLKSVGVLKRTSVDQIFGFIADPQSGGIVPATPAGEELWQLGLDNHKKFYINTKAETQLIHEALELGPYQRDDYNLPLTEPEALEADKRAKTWKSSKSLLIGLNTGCSAVIAAKKMTVATHRELILKIQTQIPNAKIVLLGGPEDSERNFEIGLNLDVIQSETRGGLRDGLVSVAACDVIVTGDSLGMHMAISQRKQVVAWFGPTCAHEIDLYDRGVKVLTQSLCSPCWKRTCEKSIMCYDQVSLEEIVHGIKSCSANSLSGRSAAFNSASKEVSNTLA